MNSGTAEKLAALTLCASLAIMSTMSGMTSALQAGYGLGKYGGLGLVPRLLALEIPRESAPRIAGVSACLSFAAWAHRRSPTPELLRGPHAWVPFLVVPVAFVVAAPVAVLAGAATSAMAHDVAAMDFIRSVVEVARAEDLLYGLLRSIVFAIVLRVTAGIVVRKLPIERRPLWSTLALTWLGAVALLTILGLGFEAIWRNPRSTLGL